MYLIYVDESGDPGTAKGGTPFFVISGLIVHETDWNEVFQRFMDLRRGLSMQYNIPQRINLHATDIVNGHKDFHHTQFGLTITQRFFIYHEVLEFLAQLPQIRFLNVVIRKDRINDPATDVFEWGWNLFIQRFSNFLERGGHLKKTNEFGLLFTDRTNDKKLKRLMRKMRAYNYVPSKFVGTQARKVLITRVLDDPIPRISTHSYYLQMADMAAFALARRDYKRPALDRFKFQSYFDILDPVLLVQASSYNQQGIVYWPR